MSDITDEKLKKMLEEGKISQEQYEELKANLPEQPQTGSDSRSDKIASTTCSLWKRFQ